MPPTKRAEGRLLGLPALFPSRRKGVEQMQSISRAREVKESAELYERILEAEGMPAEFPNDERVSFAALDEVVAAGLEETDGDSAEEGAPRLGAADDLSPADRAVVERIKAAGWAATQE